MGQHQQETSCLRTRDIIKFLMESLEEDANEDGDNAEGGSGSVND